MPHWYSPAQSVSEKARLRRRAFLADFAETMTTMRSQVRVRCWIDIEQGTARDAPCITVLLGNEGWPRVPRALCVGAGRSTIALELRRLVAESKRPAARHSSCDQQLPSGRLRSKTQKACIAAGLAISGARSWTRTNDPLINSQVL